MENQTKQFEEELEINLGDYVRVIWRRKKSILAIFVLVVILAVIISFTLPKIYESSAVISIGKFGDSYIESQSEVSAFLEQPSTLQALTQKLDLPAGQWPILKDMIKVEPVDKIDNLVDKINKSIDKIDKLLRISAQANNPQLAKKIVEAAADLLLERHQKMLIAEQEFYKKEIQSLDADIQTAENRIVEMEKEVARLKYPKTEIEALLAQSYITALPYEREQLLNLEEKRKLNYSLYQTKVKTPAFEPVEPIKPNKKWNILIGVLLGLFIGIFYAFVAEYWQKNKSKFTA